jgi:hypothetical protein
MAELLGALLALIIALALILGDYYAHFGGKDDA